MKTGWIERAGMTLAIGALAVLAEPAQGSAATVRQRQDDSECRCVDANGAPIDDCACFRMPSFEMAFAPFAVRPRLGVSVDSEQPSSIDAQGAEVTSVLEDGPADEAGLQEGDIITRIGGRSLLEPLDEEVEEDFDLDGSLPVQRLLSVARGLEPGEEVEIEYLRDGRRLTATLEARELSGRSFAHAYGIDADRMRADVERLRDRARGMRSRRLRVGPPDSSGSPGARFFGGDAPWVIGPLGSSRYGLQLIELNEGLGAYFGTSEGVLVLEVDEDSTLGLRPGDVILSVGDRDVALPDRVLGLLGTYDDGEGITFRIRRNGAEMSVMGRLDG